MEDKTHRIDRRDFFFKGALIAGLGIVGTAWIWIFEDLWTAASRFSSARWIPIAEIKQFPAEGVIPFPEHKIAMIRLNQTIGAISLECTHLGCLVNVVDRGFFCPCHGSDFGPLGQVYSGPATRPLPWHDIRNLRDRIWVHLGKKLESPRWLEIEEGPHEG